MPPDKTTKATQLRQCRNRTMPPNTSPRSPSANQAVADRATALRNAGVRRTCARNQQANQHPEPTTTTNNSPEHDAASPADQNIPTHDPAQHHDQADTLPDGCAMGIPVPLGRPVTRLPQRGETIDLAIMRSIQSDNYKFIRHMITTGWTPVSPSACSFSVKINRAGEEQEVWHVREATPLHYAVCSGSLEAAAGLLVGFPELAFASCQVEAGGGTDGVGRTSRWTALEFASFFGSLYVGVDEERHGAYQEASLVLLHLREHPRRLPCMQHDTPAQRLSAAPKHPRDLVHALRAAMR